ncbi:MAG TPA: hypothetical protein VK645_12495 [Chitinophagaceae bacterium]|nr:hypothetical protein [Chitinophagaceae bacterium]
MQPTHFFKASILMLAIVIGFVACWEYYWRSRGFKPTYNDDKVLWAQQRKKLTSPTPRSTVIIGGSRIKFAFDIPTWEKLTGEEAIQLAIVGTPSRLTLRDLASDSTFEGKLIIDVAESQFFSIDTTRRDKSAREAIEYYYAETPAQKASASINYVLESKFVFLEEGKFGLTNLLNSMQMRNRADVVVRPPFPKEFSITNFNRQTAMTPMFLNDRRLQQKQRDYWEKFTVGVKGDTLLTILKGFKASIDKIRSRGGVVIFVRPPSSGDILEKEKSVFPRQQYWDRLLAYTNTPGIHYSDYAATANFVCPECSHLVPRDAVTYTTALIRILREEKGWVFPVNDSPAVANVKPQY